MGKAICFLVIASTAMTAWSAQAEFRRIRAQDLQVKFDSGTGTIRANQFIYTHPTIEPINEDVLRGTLTYHEPNLSIESDTGDYNLGDLFRILGNCNETSLVDGNFDIEGNNLQGSLKELRRSCPNGITLGENVSFTCQASDTVEPSTLGLQGSLESAHDELAPVSSRQPTLSGSARISPVQADVRSLEEDDQDRSDQSYYEGSSEEPPLQDKLPSSAHGSEGSFDFGDAFDDLSSESDASSEISATDMISAEASMLKPCVDGKLAFKADKFEAKSHSFFSRVTAKTLSDIRINVNQNKYNVKFTFMKLSGSVKGEIHFLEREYGVEVRLDSARVGGVPVTWLTGMVTMLFAENAVRHYKKDGHHYFKVLLNRI